MSSDIKSPPEGAAICGVVLFGGGGATFLRLPVEGLSPPPPDGGGGGGGGGPPPAAGGGGGGGGR